MRVDFAEALEETAQHWDGVARTKSGKQMHEATLAVQPTVSGQWKAMWIVNTPAGFIAAPVLGRWVFG